MKIIAKCLVVVLLTTISGGQLGCGSSEAEKLPEASVVAKSDGRIVGELTPEKVKSANSGDPLRIALAAQDRTNGGARWEFVRIYFEQNLAQKPLVVWSESDPAKKVVFWPSFTVSGFETKIADWFGNLIRNEQGQPINFNLAWTSLLGSLARTKNSDDWLANLAKVGLALAIAAIPVLIAVGAIAVVYIISGIVLKALAGIVWAVFLIGVFTFLAATVWEFVKGVMPSLNVEAISQWANRTWAVVKNFLTEALASPSLAK